jgi:hypothetical protein
MFLFGKLQGAPGTPSRLDALVLAHAARSPTLEARIASSMAGELSPLDVVAPTQALAWVLGAALRGQLGLLGDFYRHARILREIASVLALHRRLLAGSAAGGRPSLGGPPRAAKNPEKNRHHPPRALA